MNTSEIKDDLVLGLSDSHDCGTSILKADKLIYAVNEERISRKKNLFGA